MKELIKKLYISLLYGLLYFPILVLMLYSINDARYSLQWNGFSLRWYHTLFNDQSLWNAFFHSIVLGLTAAIAATVLSIIACLYRLISTQRQQRLFNVLLLLLVVVPDLVFGVALLIFFSVTGIPLGFMSLLIAHITFCIPFAIFTINSRIQTLDVNIYYSALDLGATQTTAVVRIIVPILWPAVLSAFLMCFTLSFDDVIISYFIAGPDFNILPLSIYSLVRAGVTPELNALCTITLLISMVLVLLSQWIKRKAI